MNSAHCFCFQIDPPLTCSPLDNDDKLDAISLVQGSSSLLVEVGMPEVPTHRVEQTEVVPEHKFYFMFPLIFTVIWTEMLPNLETKGAFYLDLDFNQNEANVA